MGLQTGPVESHHHERWLQTVPSMLDLVQMGLRRFEVRKCSAVLLYPRSGRNYRRRRASRSWRGPAQQAVEAHHMQSGEGWREFARDMHGLSHVVLDDGEMLLLAAVRNKRDG